MLHLPPFIAAMSQGRQREMERGRSDSPRTPSGSKGVGSEAVMSHAVFSTVTVWLTERTMDLGTTENISAPLTQENKSARDSNALVWAVPSSSKATVKRTLRVSAICTIRMVFFLAPFFPTKISRHLFNEPLAVKGSGATCCLDANPHGAIRLPDGILNRIQHSLSSFHHRRSSIRKLDLEPIPGSPFPVNHSHIGRGVEIHDNRFSGA